MFLKSLAYCQGCDKLSVDTSRSCYFCFMMVLYPRFWNFSKDFKKLKSNKPLSIEVSVQIIQIKNWKSLYSQLKNMIFSSFNLNSIN